MKKDDDEASAGEPVRRQTASFGAISPPAQKTFATFEEQFTDWIKNDGKIYEFGLNDTLIQTLVRRAAVFARKRGMNR